MDSNKTLPSGILELICSSCDQTVVDYFVQSITTGRQEQAYNALISEGFSTEQADEFIEEIEKLHLDDLDKVKTIQQALQCTDEELIDLANTILRVLD